MRTIPFRVSHVCKDIVEAKAMVRELQRGIARDEKELAMSKRKSKSWYSGSLKRDIKEDLATARKNAAAKRCEAAISGLVTTAVMVGYAKGKGAKSSRRGRGGLTSTTKRVISACLRK